MRISPVYLVLLIVPFLYSCKNDDTTTAETTTTEQPATPFAGEPFPATSPDPQTSNPLQQVNTLPKQQSNQGAQQFAPPPLPTSNNTAGNHGPLNPPHGQPGHRCDIPVGAPLSAPPQPTQSPAANMPPPQTIQAPPVTPVNVPPPTISAPAPQQTKTVTPPGINPPHGEPGHKCEVAVGDSLPH